MRTAAVLDRLERIHGVQTADFPSDPYEFLVWWHCGYPASDAACARGWESLRCSVGVRPEELLLAKTASVAAALAPGGMVPELRAMRLKEIATRAGDLESGLRGPLPEARKTLKRFPGIADPGADRILLFSGIAPVAAVPSNVPHVLVRILHGRERENYGVTYREAQEALGEGVGDTVEARQRAYLLVKRHGQEICKRLKPRCEECALRQECAYAAGRQRGRATRA
jgi:endonuclease III